jgi:uncharacterized membrane protein YfcA
VLTNFAGMVIQESTGTVLAASTIIVIVGAVSFYRKGLVNTQLALTVGLSGVVGAFLAARWASTIQSTTLEHVFGAFTLGLSVYMSYTFFILEPRRSRSLASRSMDGFATRAAVSAPVPISPGLQSQRASRLTGTDPVSLAVQISKGLLIGVATGLFGVGLASLSVVLFMLLFKLDTKMILGTSLAASFFRYLGGSVGYLTTGLINPFYFVVLVVGGAIGSLIGARIVLGTGRGSKDIYVKIIAILILLFASYEFLLKSYLPFHLGF